MSYQKEIFETIQSLTGQANILTIPVIFVELTGDMNSALLLSQLVYWTGKSINDGWVYKTYKEWENEIYLNKYAAMKASNNLKKLGFLETKIKKANGNPTVHYRIKKDSFSLSIVQILNKRKFKNSTNDSLNFKQSITEITTEITTDIKRVSSKIFADDSIELILARELKEYILVNNPKGKVPSNLNSWANDFDKMIRIDKREVSDIRNVMRFCQNDNFWKPNILSAKKLRQKFDTLYLQMGNGLTLNNADKIKKLEDM